MDFAIWFLGNGKISRKQTMKRPNLDFRWTGKNTDAINKIETRDSRAMTRRKFIARISRKGKIYFQEKASQMVAETVELKEDERFLDVCCAPASKLSMIADQRIADCGKKLD